MRKFFHRVKPTDPLLTSRWLDVAAGTNWLLYTAYALATIVAPLMTFTTAGAPRWYQLTWAIVFGLSSLTAGLAAFSIFHEGKASKLVKKRTERDALLIMASLIAVYAILLIIVVALGYGDRFPQLIFVLSVFPFPIYRIGHLNHRIRLMFMPNKASQ